jgi:uncharacterized membrane protein
VTLKPLWHQHPHVRSGTELLFRERAADWLKARFGSWSFLIIVNALFFVWVAVDILSGNTIDPGLFFANLFLSWLAGNQGGALQIASNRGDRIASELALSTHRNGEQILQLNQQQMDILAAQSQILTALHQVQAAVEATESGPAQEEEG